MKPSTPKTELPPSQRRIAVLGGFIYIGHTMTSKNILNPSLALFGWIAITELMDVLSK